MSPFTGTSTIIREFLDGKHDVWKSISGPIGSIEILERKSSDSEKKTPARTEHIKIQVKTLRIDSSIATNPPDFPACVGIFDVEVKWDFMALKDMTVKKISVTCDDRK